MFKNKEKAFTLIELLVVIAIIGILAGILFVAIDPAAQSRKADDAKRLAFMNQLQEALELYNLDNGHYPEFTYVHTWNAGAAKTQFNTALAPYMPIDITEDYLDADTDFYYSSPSSTGYKSYGMMIKLLDSSNDHYEQNDGGYRSYTYELGPDPTYCMDKYSGSERDWWWTPLSDRCVGGN